MSAFSEFVEYSLLGLLSSGVVALIALSFVLICKGTRVVNFAVGEILMLGAYLYYTANVVFGVPAALAFALSIVIVALLSALLEVAVLRPLSGQPVVAVMMATIGLSSIIHGAVEASWGGDTVYPEPLLPRVPLSIDSLEIMIPGSVVTNFVVAAALMAAFILFFRFSKTGVVLRATASDPVTAATLGINIRYAQRLTWVLAGTVGTVAGVLLASASGLSPLLAASALSVFAVIILGGLDSVLGAIVASLFIGWLDSVVVGYVGGKARDVLPYLVVLIILLVRPYGLFGTRDIERI